MIFAANSCSRTNVVAILAKGVACRIVGAGLFFLVPSFAIAEVDRVDRAAIVACASSEHPKLCVGDASNACQRIHDDGFDGGTTQGIAACIREEKDVWQQIMDQLVVDYASALEQRDQMADQTRIDRSEAFEASQSAWRSYLEAQCRWAYAETQEGTIRVISAAACELRLTSSRVVWLNSLQLASRENAAAGNAGKALREFSEIPQEAEGVK